MVPILALTLVASQAQAESTTTTTSTTSTTTPAPTTTDTPPTTEADQVSTTTTTSVAPAAPQTAKKKRWRWPGKPRNKNWRIDPRRVRCRRTAVCKVQKFVQARLGKYPSRSGRWVCCYKGQRVRGHYKISFYRKIVRFLRYFSVRATLVRRWQGVANCESGGNWHINTGNGYYGGLQFLHSTWRSMGGPGYAHQAPAWKQAEVADRLRRGSGLHHWPHCGRYYG